jgi:putative transcriptional regulator
VKNTLRELRTDLGLSQAELATELGVSRQTVISLESGRYLPSLPLAFRIARLVSLPIEAVFQPEEEDVRA